MDGVPEISLHTAHPGSGLGRLSLDPPPYWASAWAGGVALARHLFDQPEAVAGRAVIDLGAGSGLLAIAAMLAGAASATAIEPDPWGAIAIRLNAAANGVVVGVREVRAGGLAPDRTSLILAGDVFYSAEAAAGMLACLDRFHEAGASVLIGDIGRRWLPLDRLERIASHTVRDFGDPPGTSRPAGVFRLVGSASLSGGRPLQESNGR